MDIQKLIFAIIVVGLVVCAAGFLQGEEVCAKD